MGRFDEGTDGHMEKTNGLAARLLSAFISCAMVTTLVSAPAIAHAVEATGSSAAADESALPQEQADGAERVYESVALAAPASDAEGAAPEQPAAPSASAEQQASPDIDILSVSVGIKGSSQAAIAYNGLSYLVTDEEQKSVALIGRAGNAELSGELQVPAQVVSGSTAYTVTSIEMRSGGGQR